MDDMELFDVRYKAAKYMATKEDLINLAERLYASRVSTSGLERQQLIDVCYQEASELIVARENAYKYMHWGR